MPSDGDIRAWMTSSRCRSATVAARHFGISVEVVEEALKRTAPAQPPPPVSPAPQPAAPPPVASIDERLMNSWQAAEARALIAAQKAAQNGDRDEQLKQEKNAARARRQATAHALGVEAPQLPAVRKPPKHAPGSLAWYEMELEATQHALDTARGRSSIDAQGCAALSRSVILLAGTCRQMREAEAARTTSGLSLAEREARLADAAHRMPTALLEIFALEWASRHRVDLVALREARLVRADEG